MTSTFDSHLEGKKVDSFVGSDECRDCGNIVNTDGTYWLLEQDVQKAKQEALRKFRFEVVERINHIDKAFPFSERVQRIGEYAVVKRILEDCFGRME